MNMLTKTKTVLVLKRQLFDTVQFGWEDDGSGEKIPTDGHDLPYEKWLDMGKPETITVTVEVGDTLNEED